MPVRYSPPPFQWPDPHVFIQHVTRARTQGIVLSPIPRFTRIESATSASDPSKTYFVDEFVCSCLAGRMGNLCKHRALYIFSHMERVIDDHGLPDWQLDGDTVRKAG